MKLRNKKTGEIHEITQAVSLSDDMNKKFAIYSQSEGHNYGYRTLAELNEEWEDYEEPKEYYYYIDDLGFPSIDREQSTTIVMRKNFGNYFVTREEAEKAVEKLKAWKRLKDKGFRFLSNKTIGEYGSISYCLTYPATRREDEDLDLLFGGGE